MTSRLGIRANPPATTIRGLVCHDPLTRVLADSLWQRFPARADSTFTAWCVLHQITTVPRARGQHTERELSPIGEPMLHIPATLEPSVGELP